MVSKKPKKRVSKAEWLEKALQVFRQEGEPGVKIESLARQLSVNKAGFYWHFRDRSDLLEQLLDYWEKEYTRVVTENSILRNLAPADRLLAVMNMIFDHNLAELDVHFNAWALKDPLVGRKVRRVILLRVKFMKRLFLEAGLEEEQADMRAKLFVGYESNEGLMFRFTSKESAKQCRELRHKLLLTGV
jgi:AcrR family transcriptional regulator